MKRAAIPLCLLMMLAPLGAQAQPSKAKRPAAAAKESCAELHRRYDLANRMIAGIDADDLNDATVPRATLRQLRILTEKQDQLILLEFMRLRNCPAPGAVGSSSLYAANAMQCATAKLKGEVRSETCNKSRWSPQSPPQTTATPAN